jgi:signal peptidase II
VNISIREQIRFFCLTVLVVGVNVCIDRITKYYAVHLLKGHPPIVLLKGLIRLEYAENSGAFLSLGAQWNTVIKYGILLVIPIGLCIFGFIYLIFKEKRLKYIIIIGTIVGGGIGNLIDRLWNNFYVIDFLNFGIGTLRTGILNIADISVTFGAVAFLIFCQEKKHNRRT